MSPLAKAKGSNFPASDTNTLQELKDNLGWPTAPKHHGQVGLRP